MERKWHLYDLPCYPDDAASNHRRVSVDIHQDFCGTKDFTVFIGGGGYASFPTRKEASKQLASLVRSYLLRRKEEAKERYEYAVAQLYQWENDPSVFLPGAPEEEGPK